jgi:hypothetical protein
MAHSPSTSNRARGFLTRVSLYFASVQESPAILSYAPLPKLDPEGAPVYLTGETSVKWMHFPAALFLLIALAALMYEIGTIPRRRVRSDAASAAHANEVITLQRTIIATFGSLSLATFAWSFCRRRPADIQPDFLAQIFPPQNILKIRDAHIVLGARQARRYLKLIVLIQNRREGAGRFKLSVAPSLFLRDVRCPPLECAVPPSGVLAASCAVPLANLQRRITFSVSFRITQCRSLGRLVRFAPHRVSGNWLPYRGWRGNLSLQLVPVAPPVDPTALAAAQWTIQTLWTPQTPTPLDAIASRVTETTMSGHSFSSPAHTDQPAVPRSAPGPSPLSEDMP